MPAEPGRVENSPQGYSEVVRIFDTNGCLCVVDLAGSSGLEQLGAQKATIRLLLALGRYVKKFR